MRFDTGWVPLMYIGCRPAETGDGGGARVLVYLEIGFASNVSVAVTNAVCNDNSAFLGAGGGIAVEAQAAASSSNLRVTGANLTLSNNVACKTSVRVAMALCPE